MRTRRRAGAEGYLVMETLLAMALLMAILAMLATSLGDQRRATQRLAERRQATRLAEQTLLQMQMPPEPPEPPEVAPKAAQDAGEPGAGERVQIEPVAGGQVPAGWSWVQVHATVGQEKVSLVGLVPEGSR